MQPFYKTVPCTPSEYFCTECIEQEKPSSDTRQVSLLITRRRVFFQKNTVRLLNKTVSKI